jgi:hypothetical protein
MKKKNEQERDFRIDLSRPNPCQRYLNICFLKIYWHNQVYSSKGRIIGYNLKISDPDRFIKCYPYLKDVSGFYCINQKEEEAMFTELLIFNLN